MTTKTQPTPKPVYYNDTATTQSNARHIKSVEDGTDIHTREVRRQEAIAGSRQPNMQDKSPAHFQKSPVTDAPIVDTAAVVNELKSPITDANQAKATGTIESGGFPVDTTPKIIPANVNVHVTPGVVNRPGVIVNNP